MIEDQDYNMDQFSDAEQKEQSHQVDIENPNMDSSNEVQVIDDEASGSSKGEEQSDHE